MKSGLLTGWVRPIGLLVAAAGGLLVLAISLVGNAGGEPGVESPPTLTASELSTRQAGLEPTLTAANSEKINELIASRASVADVRRSESAGLFSGRDHVDLQTALAASSTVLLGTPEDQILVSGPSALAEMVGTYLQSTVRLDDGSTLTVTQPVGVSVSPTGEVTLSYRGCATLLERGTRYAMLVRSSSRAGVDGYELIPGHAFDVTYGLVDVPCHDDPSMLAIDGKPLATLLLSFNAAKGVAE
jgi:hypothetical protein